MKLTAATVEKLKPTEKRQEIPDDLCTGLYLVVQPTGKRGWQVRYRHGGTHRRMTLGAYPLLSLADARARARNALAAATEGRDPAAEVKAAKAPKPEADRDKVRALFETYCKRHLSGLKSGGEQERQLAKYVLPKLGDRDVKSLKRRDMIELLEEIADTGHGVTANRIRTYFQTFLNWCLERDVIEANPIARMKPVTKERARDRVLTEDEIRWFWAACEAEGFPWGPFGKVLLLTGQRLNEVAQITEAEIRGETWHLSADRTKNKRAHDVPLSAAVREVLGSVDRVHGAPGFIFTTTGTSPVSGFFKARNALAAAMAQAAEKERGEPVTIPHWTFHDLRRTCATGLARLGIPVRVTEATLNHVSGTGGGIVGVYQRHDFADEKRAALDAWARRVAALIEGEAGNVVQLVGAR